MKILKINSITSSKLYSQKMSKLFLTKPITENKIDMFCKSKEVKEGLRNKFLKLRDSFSEKLYPAFVKESTTCWNFYINSTEENMEKFNKACDEKSNLYKI